MASATFKKICAFLSGSSYIFLEGVSDGSGLLPRRGGLADHHFETWFGGLKTLVVLTMVGFRVYSLKGTGVGCHQLPLE